VPALVLVTSPAAAAAAAAAAVTTVMGLGMAQEGQVVVETAAVGGTAPGLALAAMMADGVAA
jgi:hypothetical protein